MALSLFFSNFAHKMIRIVKYCAGEKARWDQFVQDSRNGTFLFQRGYMDYHSDRFVDHSLLFLNDKDDLVALLPGNADGHVYHSHQGLTYGGFILPRQTHANTIEELFNATAGYLKAQGFHTWIYKQIPHIYHNVPSEEEEYFLWRMGAQMVVCNLACTILIDGAGTLPVQKRMMRKIRSLEKDGVRITIGAPLERFWPLLERHLMEKHNARPVHSLQEMQLLQSRFPDNIVCATVESPQGELLAGVVAYDMGRVIHLQYSSVSEAGEHMAAQACADYALLKHYRDRANVRYFDFGTCNEEQGKVLNMSLVFFKECFGARGVAYKTWSISLS